MVPDREPRGRMEPGGRMFRGVGFIAEIQSLFYPDFDRDTPDRFDGSLCPTTRSERRRGPRHPLAAPARDGHGPGPQPSRRLVGRHPPAGQSGLLFPEGLPENVEIGLQRHNPMQGSLNAGFESLAACHGWRRGGGSVNVIDEACRRDPMLRAGIRRFWPE